MIQNYIPKNPDLGSLILRVTMGLLFLYGGVGKLFGILGGPGIQGFSNMVWGQIWIAYLVGIVELLAGIGLLIGFMSRLSSIALIIIMIFAIFMVHNPFVNPEELMRALIRLTIIGGLAQIVFTGSGKTAIQED